MTNVDLARVEFAFVSINHFFFVPITIGLAFLTALLQTAWYRSGRDDYLRLTRFFGTLLVINVAIGVVTGIVQEFQFGMNWGAYSRLVGQHLRRAAGDGGAGRVLPGVDVPGAVAVRLGQAAPPDPPADDLGGLARLRAVGGVHPGGQLLDAAPGRLHHGQRQAAAERHLGAVHQPGVRVGVCQGAVRVAGHRRGGHAGRLGVAAAARRGPGGVHPVGAPGAGRPGPGDLVHPAGGR